MRNILRKCENSENLLKSSQDFDYEKLSIFYISIPCLYKRFSSNKKGFFIDWDKFCTSNCKYLALPDLGQLTEEKASIYAMNVKEKCIE